MKDAIDRPQSSANHLVFGMDKDQRDKANLLEDNSSVHTWV